MLRSTTAMRSRSQFSVYCSMTWSILAWFAFVPRTSVSANLLDSHEDDVWARHPLSDGAKTCVGPPRRGTTAHQAKNGHGVAPDTANSDLERRERGDRNVR